MREIFLLEHRGVIQTELAFKTRESAQKYADDPHSQEWFKPSAVLKVWDRDKYERLMKEFKPPTVVRFVEMVEG